LSRVCLKPVLLSRKNQALSKIFEHAISFTSVPMNLHSVDKRLRLTE
jgi:hypothetical protein